MEEQQILPYTKKDIAVQDYPMKRKSFAGFIVIFTFSLFAISCIVAAILVFSLKEIADEPEAKLIAGIITGFLALAFTFAVCMAVAGTLSNMRKDTEETDEIMRVGYQTTGTVKDLIQREKRSSRGSHIYYEMHYFFAAQNGEIKNRMCKVPSARKYRKNPRLHLIVDEKTDRVLILK